MRRSQADSTNRSLAAFGKLQHIRLTGPLPGNRQFRGKDTGSIGDVGQRSPGAFQHPHPDGSIAGAGQAGRKQAPIYSLSLWWIS